MNLIFGRGFGGGDFRRMEFIEGTAVYQLALNLVNSGQNDCAEKRGGTITEPPEWSGARNPASRPWTWKRGMTR